MQGKIVAFQGLNQVVTWVRCRLLEGRAVLVLTHLLKVCSDLLMALERIAVDHVVVLAVLRHKGHDALDVAGVVVFIELEHDILGFSLYLHPQSRHQTDTIAGRPSVVLIRGAG